MCTFLRVIYIYRYTYAHVSMCIYIYICMHIHVGVAFLARRGLPHSIVVRPFLGSQRVNEVDLPRPHESGGPPIVVTVSWVEW